MNLTRSSLPQCLPIYPRNEKLFMTWADFFTLRHLPSFDGTSHDIFCVEVHQYFYSYDCSYDQNQTNSFSSNTVIIILSQSEQLLDIPMNPAEVFCDIFYLQSPCPKLCWCISPALISTLYTLACSPQESHVTKAKDVLSIRPPSLIGVFVLEKSHVGP